MWTTTISYSLTLPFTITSYSMDVSKFVVYAVIVRLCSSVPLNEFYQFGDSNPFDIRDDVSSAIDLGLSISISLTDCSDVATMNVCYSEHANIIFSLYHY